MTRPQDVGGVSLVVVGGIGLHGRWVDRRSRQAIDRRAKRRKLEREIVLSQELVVWNKKKIRDKSVVVPQRDEDLLTLRVSVLLILQQNAAIILIVGD